MEAFISDGINQCSEPHVEASNRGFFDVLHYPISNFDVTFCHLIFPDTGPYFWWLQSSNLPPRFDSDHNAPSDILLGFPTPSCRQGKFLFTDADVTCLDILHSPVAPFGHAHIERRFLGYSIAPQICSESCLKCSYGTPLIGLPTTLPTVGLSRPIQK